MAFKKSLSQKLRMDGRDYSRPGWFFITLGADYHRQLFGRVEGVEMRPNALGQLIEQCWADIPRHYSHIELGEWQVMPNHFHGLMRIVRPGGNGLGEVVNMFKGSVTREWRRAQGVYVAGARHGEKDRDVHEDAPSKIWAPNYWDVICFDAHELAVRERYIRANPRRWAVRDVPQGQVEGGFYRGNLALLDRHEPHKALRISRQASEEEIGEWQMELAAYAGVVCSTFISEGERACLKGLLAGGAKVLWVSPVGLPESIPVVWAGAFVAGRALWVSEYNERLEHVTRAGCERANEWVRQLSTGNG